MTLPQPALLSVELLEELKSRWRERGAPLVENLRPGLSEAQIEEALAPIGQRLPTEAVVWWKWHDGAAKTGRREDRMLGGRQLEYFSLSEAVEMHRYMRTLAVQVAEREQRSLPGNVAYLADPDYWWSPTWMPITQAAGGAVLSCDCSVTTGHVTPIRSVGDWGADPFTFERVRTRSFGELVSWWIEALEIGAWQYDHTKRVWAYDWDRLPPELRLSHVV